MVPSCQGQGRRGLPLWGGGLHTWALQERLGQATSETARPTPPSPPGPGHIQRCGLGSWAPRLGPGGQVPGMGWDSARRRIILSI